jgi:hypothetical protein
MRAARVAAGVLAAALALAAQAPRAARADTVWLPGPARAIPRTASASRDAAVFEYAYGPRAQATIGMEPGVLELRRASVVTRFGLYALAGLEDATNTRLFPPAELWRGLVGVSFAWELPAAARAWLVPGSTLELGLVVGHESDHATASSSSALEPPGPRTIPFGGGGNFVAPDVAVRLPAGRTVTIDLRLADRVYFSELPLLVGARAASDAVAGALHEGLASAASADVVVRWRALSWAHPILAAYGEHLFARDPFVDDGGFLRVLAGIALPGRLGEVEPFGSFDAGNGKGLLVERRELRLSVGVRYAPF